jgi:hypothetical protein
MGKKDKILSKETQMNELKKRYSELNDYELINIVYFESSEYREEAIKVAKSVLEERGLTQPTDEILQRAKEYRKAPASDFDEDFLGKDVFKKGSLKRAVKKRDYFFIGKWLFWVVIANGFYTAFRINSSFEISSQRTGLPIWILQIFEIISTIAIFGLIPVIFFVVYSLRLSKEQRAEKRLTLLMPMYVLIIYGISLLIFIAFFI